MVLKVFSKVPPYTGIGPWMALPSSYKQRVECKMSGNHGNDDNHGNPRYKRVPQTTGLDGAKSPEIPQKEGVLGSEIANR